MQIINKRGIKINLPKPVVSKSNTTTDVRATVTLSDGGGAVRGVGIHSMSSAVKSTSAIQD